VTAKRRSRPSAAPPSADGADVPDADRANGNDEKPKRAQRTTLKQNPPTNKKAEPKGKPASAHRTTATQRERIRGYPEKLFIYRHNASPFWWVRYWEKGKTFRKSTKTERKQDAVAFAKQYFADLKHQIQHGKVSLRSASSYAVVLKSLLSSEYAKMSRGQLTKITYDNLVYRYEKKITPFFRLYAVLCGSYHIHRAPAGAIGFAGRWLSLDILR